MLISINPSLSINFTPQQSKSIIDVNVYKYIEKQCKHEIMKLNKIRPNLSVEEATKNLHLLHLKGLPKDTKSYVSCLRAYFNINRLIF